MKRDLGILIMLLICLFIANQKSAKAMEDITEFVWKKRIILVLAQDDGGEYNMKFNEADYAINDRHIYWFVITPERVHSNYPGEISNRFARKAIDRYFQDKGNSAILIGKDGGVKMRQKTLFLQDLFDLIDTMPMRKQEMMRE